MSQIRQYFFCSNASVLLLSFLWVCLSRGCTEPGWIPQESGVSSRLQSVWFTDENRGIIVGNQGTILLTTDGGITWTQQVSGTDLQLTEVCFADSSHGWVAGFGIILHTNDGGTTWVQQVSGASGAFGSVFCLDTGRVWVVNSDFEDRSIIFHTVDGGDTWTSQWTGLKGGLAGIFFTDAETGTVVGGWCRNCMGKGPYFGGYILRTTDGGDSWHIQLLDTTLFGFHGVYFTDNQKGIVVGSDGAILRTIDGGASWSRRESGTTYDLKDVFFAGTDTGTAVGEIYTSRYEGGVILRTTDGGITWKMQDLPGNKGFRSVFFSDAVTGTAVGHEGIILHTTSGGEPVPGRIMKRSPENIKEAWYDSHSVKSR